MKAQFNYIRQLFLSIQTFAHFIQLQFQYHRLSLYLHFIMSDFINQTYTKQTRRNLNLINNHSNLIIQNPTSTQSSDQQMSQSHQISQNSMTELQEKQKYLREQILSKNFSPQDFIEYMNSKLNIQSNINLCSLSDLKKVVQSYIRYVQKSQIHMSQFDDQSQNLKNSMISVTSLPPVLIIKLNSQPKIEEEEFRETIKCNKIELKYSESELKSKKISCNIHSPMRKFVSSFLGVNTSSYLNFKVKTFGKGWQVDRRYSDFIWLRNTLRRFYPSQIIPPIPNKKAHKRSPRQLQKRMRILTFFLNQLLSYPEFMNSRYLQGFLTMQNDKFSSFKKQVDNKKSFETISTTETVQGEFEICLSKQIVAYNKELPKWIDDSEIALKNLTRSSKNLQSSIIEQVNILYDMGDQLAGLHEGTSRISQVEDRPSSGFNRLKNIFVALNNMVVEWGSLLRDQIELIESNCNIVYKYVRQSLSGARELIQKSKEQQAKYFQAKVQLEVQKQKLFALHDIHKWDIPKSQLPYIPKSAIYEKRQAFKLMLPKQSSMLQKLKLSYCFYLTRIYNNADIFMGLKASLLCSAIQEFTIKQKVTNQQLGQMWSQTSYNFSHAFQGEKKKKKLRLKTQEKIKKQQNDPQNYEQSSIETVLAQGVKL